MTPNNDKSFNERYEHITKESSQSQWRHLEAIPFQLGCNAQWTVLLEKAMRSNHYDVFAKGDINHTLNEFYTAVNIDDQLAVFWLRQKRLSSFFFLLYSF